MSSMRKILYTIWQCTWGVVQTLLGGIIFLKHIRCKHYNYHGAIVTQWGAKASMSLGLFVFVSAEPYFANKFAGEMSADECAARLLVHEYGHTIQSLILGPLYLPVIGIPSTWWGFVSAKKRNEKQLPYGSFFTERWANRLGEQVTGENSIGLMVLD